MDWEPYFPHFLLPLEAQQPHHPGQEGLPLRRLCKDIEVLDLGCGFGGLLVALAPIMPDTLLLGE